MIATVNDAMRDRVELRLAVAFVEPIDRAHRRLGVIRDGRCGVKRTVARGHLRVRVRTNLLEDAARDSLAQSTISADFEQLELERRTAAVEYQYFHRHRGRQREAAIFTVAERVASREVRRCEGSHR